MAACVGQRSAGAVLHSAFHKDLQSGVPTIGKLAFNYNGLDLWFMDTLYEVSKIPPWG